MAETNQTNPYAGATQVTADPYAGAVPVTQDPYSGSVPTTQEKKDDFSILGEAYNIVVGGARNVAAGTLSSIAFKERISPTAIGQSIGKAIRDKDSTALNALNNALKEPNAYEIAANKIAAPESMRPTSTSNIGFPDIKVGKNEIPLGFKDVPVGEFAQDIGQFMVPYGGITKGMNLFGAKNLPEILKQGSKVVGAGAIAEQFAFSPYEERLSSVIQEVAPNAVTEFLAADPDDNEAVARFKMAVEGAGISIPVEGLFRFAGKLRANKKAQEIQPVDVPESKALETPDQTVKTEAVTSGPYAGSNVVTPMGVAEAKAQKQAERLAKKKNPFKVDDETGIITAKIKGNDVAIVRNADDKYEASIKDTMTDQEINDALENLQTNRDLSPVEVQEATKLLKQEKINRPIKTYESLSEAKTDITKTFDPGVMPRSLKPSTEPKVRRAKEYIVRNISPEFYRKTELINAIGAKNDKLPPWVFPYGGDARVGAGWKDFDSIQEAMEQDGFLPAREIYQGEVPDLADDIVDAIADNRIHPEDQIPYDQWKQAEARKLEKIDILEENGFDPLRMSDADVEQAFKKINERDADIDVQADRIEQENISRQQTDEIYQQTIAREKTISISQEDLDKIKSQQINVQPGTKADIQINDPQNNIQEVYNTNIPDVTYPKFKIIKLDDGAGVDQPYYNVVQELSLKDAYDEQQLSNLARTNKLSDEDLINLKEDIVIEQDFASLDDAKTFIASNVIDKVPSSYTPKDYGFANRPPRVPPSDTPPGGSIPDDKFAGNINLDKINEPSEIKDIIRKIAKDNSSFEEARRGVVKFGTNGENLEALARSLGLSDSTLLKRNIGQAFNSEEVMAARILFDEALKDAFDLSVIAKGTNASQIDLVRFQQSMARVASIQEQISGITAEAGRALRSFRESVGPASSKNPQARDKLIQDYLNVKGGDANIKDIAQKMSMLDDPAAMAKFARDQFKPRFIDYIQEFWINALLSSPSTHLVNTLSNTLVAGLTPLEYFGASAIGAITRKPDRITFGESGARLFGSMYGALDGIRAARKAIIDGEAVDPMTKLELDRQKVIPGPIGSLIRTPGTALVAEDAFFKSIGYRQELWGQAFRTAQKEGKGIKRAYELMRNPDLLDPKIHLDAIDAGRYQTFTTPLAEGKIGTAGQSLQKVIRKVPSLRFIVPFVRTPVNIVRYAFERFPGTAMFTTAYKKAIKQGGRQADLARSKLAIGSSVAAGVYYYAGSGLITGRGPSDSRQRSVMLETGWQPYSLKIGDKYYSYNRFEPIGILFGLTADISDIGRYVERGITADEELEIGQLTSMIAASFSENITNKTFLTGLSDAIEMLNDPDRYGEVTIRKFLASFVPTALYYERKADDPIIRDARSLGDSFVNRFPEVFSELGARTSKDLPARRNVFGEIKTYKDTFGGRYSPVNVSPIKNDVAFNEFVKLGYIPPLPKRQIGDVKLTPEQYERLLETQQTLGLRQQVESFIKVPGYNRIPKSKKIERLNKIFRDSQTASRKILQTYYPQIIIEEVEQTLAELKE